jgi:hypothetical protein
MNVGTGLDVTVAVGTDTVGPAGPEICLEQRWDGGRADA